MNVSNKTINIWRKNRKLGYRFFEPHNANKPLPRTLRQALGYKAYNELDFSQFHMRETTKAYVAGLIILILCISTWLF